MGAAASLASLSKGIPRVEMLSEKMLTDRLLEIFIPTDFKKFEDFHIQVLEIINKINSGMPGVRYDSPERKDVVECFHEWGKASDEEKKKKLEGLIKRANPDITATIVTGVVVPPTSVVAKRIAEKVPQLNMIKIIPDAVFVPSATLIVLALVRYFRKSAIRIPGRQNHNHQNTQEMPAARS